MDLRCNHKMHGVVTDNAVLEVRCSSKFCGARPGVVVIHRFSVATGELVGTTRYKAVGNSKRTRNRRVA